MSGADPDPKARSITAAGVPAVVRSQERVEADEIVDEVLLREADLPGPNGLVVPFGKGCLTEVRE